MPPGKAGAAPPREPAEFERKGFINSLTSDTPRRLLNVRDAARYLGRTEKSIRHLVSRRKIKAIRGDGRIMFDVTDLDGWININRF